MVRSAFWFRAVLVLAPVGQIILPLIAPDISHRHWQLPSALRLIRIFVAFGPHWMVPAALASLLVGLRLRRLWAGDPGGVVIAAVLTTLACMFAASTVSAVSMTLWFASQEYARSGPMGPVRMLVMVPFVGVYFGGYFVFLSSIACIPWWIGSVLLTAFAARRAAAESCDASVVSSDAARP